MTAPYGYSRAFPEAFDSAMQRVIISRSVVSPVVFVMSITPTQRKSAAGSATRSALLVLSPHCRTFPDAGRAQAWQGELPSRGSLWLGTVHRAGKQPRE